MYTNKAYLNNSLIDIKDKTKPLIVTSCGTYKLYTRSVFYTLRPKGRIDFQLLYIVSGKAHFHFNGKETIVHAGHMVLYRPKNRSNTSITQKIRPKYTGFILLAVMLPICSVLMDLQTIKKFFPAVPIWNTNNFFVR